MGFVLQQTINILQPHSSHPQALRPPRAVGDVAVVGENQPSVHLATSHTPVVTVGRSASPTEAWSPKAQGSRAKQVLPEGSDCRTRDTWRSEKTAGEGGGNPASGTRARGNMRQDMGI